MFLITALCPSALERHTLHGAHIIAGHYSGQTIWLPVIEDSGVVFKDTPPLTAFDQFFSNGQESWAPSKGEGRPKSGECTHVPALSGQGRRVWKIPNIPALRLFARGLISIMSGTDSRWASHWTLRLDVRLNTHTHTVKPAASHGLCVNESHC